MQETQNSKLPKWPFLVGDGALIILACFIVISSPKPMTALTIFACALSVILGMLIYITPYVLEHLTQQQTIKLKQVKAESSLLRASEMTEELLKRAEDAHANLTKCTLMAKQFPTVLEEKSEELLDAFDPHRFSVNIQELSDVASRLEAIPLQSRSEHENTGTKARENEINQSLKKILTRLQIIEDTVKIDKTISSTLPASQLVEKVPQRDEDLDSKEPAISSNQPVSPTKETEISSEAPELESAPNEEIENSNFPTQSNETESKLAAETNDLDKKLSVQLNEDGATRLLVAAFIGISNKLYIRGDGPGLSWDSGVPMELVGIGKWEWKTYEANSAINCKVLINDEQWTDSTDIEIPPETTVETSASF